MILLYLDLFLIDYGMSFSPDERCENWRPEIQLRNPPERQSVHRLKNRRRKIPLWSKLLLLPCFQQLPYVAEPFFQLGNIILVEMARAVDTAANLVDVRCDRITDPNRPTINVTQWCKREGCWNSVQKINLILPAEFSSVLIGKTEVRAAEKEARKDQKCFPKRKHRLKYFNILQINGKSWPRLRCRNAWHRPMKIWR